MKVRIAAALLFAVAGSSALQAQNAPRVSFMLQPDSRLFVEGTSTVRSYKCEAESIDGWVQGSGATLQLGRVAQEVNNGSLSVLVDRLECGNGTMNGHMRRALKSAEHPRIDFSLGSVSVSGSAASLSGTLRIAGQTRPVTVQGELVEEANGALRLRGTYDLVMTEYGVAPPRLMAGTMKVHDPVKISFDVLFRQ